MCPLNAQQTASHYLLSALVLLFVIGGGRIRKLVRESNNILKTLVTARKKERNGNFVRICDGDRYSDDGDSEPEEGETCCCCCCRVRAALEYYLHDGTSDTF